MKNLKWALFLFVLLSGVCPQIQAATLENAEKLIQKGEFTAAKKEIDLYIAENDLSKLEIYNLNARKEILDRIALDFDKDLPSVLNYVKKYYPEADEAFLRSYEKEGSLQMMVIDGKKWYFDRGATNMFRINEEARKRKQEIDPPSTDKTGEVLKVHLPQVIQKARETGNPLGDPVRMKVKYTLTVRPDAVPPGETLRCWLPFPREHRRQKDVITHWVNSPDYIISPDRYEHKALYMEKKQQPGKPTVFEYEFSYTSFPEWFDLKPEGIKPYDKESELYKKYTAERDTHVIFSEPIRELSEKVVGDEKNPYLIVDRIMRWIREEYPWAGAREYSTFENIPEFVVQNGHGDCGMVALLLIALARYNGVPAKWQSGFMMHPGSSNLHDWAEVYFEGVGWVPADPSFIRRNFETTDEGLDTFYSRGIDAYRWIVNEDYSCDLYPAKTYLRSETVDFQRGEVEWRGGNLFFNDWSYRFKIDYSE